jgi:hypothetical protein
MTVNISKKHAVGESGKGVFATHLPSGVLCQFVSGTLAIVGEEPYLLFIYSDGVLSTSLPKKECCSLYKTMAKGSVVTLTQTETELA